MNATKLVERRDQAHVAWLRFNQPARMNAMDEALGNALLAELDTISTDDDVRVVVLTGNGKAFSAGGDLNMLEENAKTPPADVEARMRAFYGRYLQMRRHPKPIVAAINGYAIGAGMCIALACDLRIAAHNTKMGLNFAKLGLSPGMGATFLLPQLVGPERALDLLFTGRTVEAQEAVTLGLVNRSVAPEALETSTQSWAETIAANAPIALRYIKRFVYDNIGGTLDAALQREAFGQAATFGTQDLQSGLAAIREKTTPTFRGH